MGDVISMSAIFFSSTAPSCHSPLKSSSFLEFTQYSARVQVQYTGCKSQIQHSPLWTFHFLNAIKPQASLHPGAPASFALEHSSFLSTCSQCSSSLESLLDRLCPPRLDTELSCFFWHTFPCPLAGRRAPSVFPTLCQALGCGWTQVLLMLVHCTQCLWQNPSRCMEASLDGRPGDEERPWGILSLSPALYFPSWSWLVAQTALGWQGIREQMPGAVKGGFS